MKGPNTVNLIPPEEIRRQGWAAEARDKDGHLISTQAGPPLCGVEEICQFVAEYGPDCTITIWPFGDLT